MSPVLRVMKSAKSKKKKMPKLKNTSKAVPKEVLPPQFWVNSLAVAVDRRSRQAWWAVPPALWAIWANR